MQSHSNRKQNSLFKIFCIVCVSIGGWMGPEAANACWCCTGACWNAAAPACIGACGGIFCRAACGCGVKRNGLNCKCV